MKTKVLSKFLILILSVSLINIGLSFPVRAEVVTNTSVPFFLSFDNPCSGESVFLSGNLHVLVHVTFDGNGGAHFYEHFQPMGVSGEGLFSGRRYQATGETITRTNFSSSGVVTDNFVNNFKIIGQGRGGNFLVHANFHVTINANGDLTAFVDNASSECR